MARVIWSPQALDDVDAIAAFIARDSPAAAGHWVARLIEATDQLREFPKSGRAIPELSREDYRELLVGVYRVMYRLDENDVRITGVVHGTRDWFGST